MKKCLFITVLTFLCIGCSVNAQQSKSFDLHRLYNKKKIDVFNRDITLIHEKGFAGIQLNPAYGEGVAWIKGLDFENGIIEFDVRGKNEKQRSFVGIAFHSNNDTTFDAIYLRPFQFLEKNEELRKRGIQYISLPAFTWRKLRENSPGKYESELNTTADPDGWVHLKVVIVGTTVSAYINRAQKPSLVVEKITGQMSGRIGFYVADVSGGDFANLVITKVKHGFKSK